MGISVKRIPMATGQRIYCADLSTISLWLRHGGKDDI